MALVVLVLLLTCKALAALWRLLRRASLDKAACTAGAITGVAQDKAAQLTRTFRDGRGR